MTYVYVGAGRAARLPCSAAAASSPACSGTAWYMRRAGRSTAVVQSGKVAVVRSSAVSLDPNCSLVLRNVAAQDAGLYMCAHEEYHFLFLSVLQGESGSLWCHHQGSGSGSGPSSPNPHPPSDDR